MFIFVTLIFCILCNSSEQCRHHFVDHLLHPNGIQIALVEIHRKENRATKVQPDCGS